MSPTYGSKVDAANMKTGSFWASIGMLGSCWPRPMRAAAITRPTDKVDLNASRKKLRRESGILVFVSWAVTIGGRTM